jgi:membrane-associated protein
LVPRYISGQVGGYLLPLLVEEEPEVRLELSFLFPFVWVIVPFASIVFCFLSWVAYSVSLKGLKSLEEMTHVLGTLLLVASIFPALLVVRELLVYEPFGLTGAAISSINALNDLFFGPLTRLVNPALILGWGGTWGVPTIIFVETGLFFGFFLPGDSLLVAAGVLASIGEVNLLVLIPSAILAAIAGDQLNYFIGQRSGRVLAERFQFVRVNLGRAEAFYDRHGGKAILLARFVPVIRTFAPAVAGGAKMHYVRFAFFNVAGGALWVASMTVLGYSVGRIIPNVTAYLYLVIAIVILVSVLPSGVAWGWKRYRSRQKYEPSGPSKDVKPSPRGG